MTSLRHIQIRQVTYRYYRLEFANTNAIKIGFSYWIVLHEFEFRFYRDIPAPHLNEDVIVTNNKKPNQAFLGRSLVRTGIAPNTIMR